MGSLHPRIGDWRVEVSLQSLISTYSNSPAAMTSPLRLPATFLIRAWHAILRLVFLDSVDHCSFPERYVFHLHWSHAGKDYRRQAQLHRGTYLSNREPRAGQSWNNLRTSSPCRSDRRDGSGIA